MALFAGSKLGSYEIVSLIGAGGMGEVYKAKDTRLDRTVAIKVLPSHLSDNPDLKQRFEREARAVSSLNHPHICTLHDIGEQDGVDFLVMEFIEGESLADRLRKGALPLDQALRHGIEIADALDKAHRQGVVHRDLKPGNIMLTKSGAKLLDFGLAKFRTDVSAETPSVLSALPTEEKPLTEKGAILGTVQYMAPEQLEGKDADHRTDLFAFGAVLYEMVTGRKAFEGKSQASLISAIMSSDPPPVSTIKTMTPPALDHVVKTCLAKDPDERWQSASDVMRDLRWITESGSAATMAATARKGGWLAWVALVLFAAVVSGIAAWNLKRISPSITRFSVTLPDGSAFTQLRQKALDLSPDSSRIVFVANNQLHLRPVNQMESTPIPGTQGGESPFFSPDGQWIGFWAGGELKKALLGGGPPQRLCSTRSPEGVTWGPSGTIFFSDGRDIYRVPATGGEPQVVIASDREADTFLGNPEILPDGDTLLFDIEAAGLGFDEMQIVAQSLRSNDRRVLLKGGSQPRYLSTGHLVYFREDTLLAVPFDPASLEIKGNSVPLVRDVGRVRAEPRAHYSLSRSGGLVYIPSASSPFGSRLLVWVDRDGNVTPLTEERRGYSYPKISPDGRRVAFQVAEQFGGVANVWLYDQETRSSSQFTFESTSPWLNPTWTPDGERLTFRDKRDGVEGIFWKLADGSDDAELLLSKEEFILPYSWSPEGVLAFYHRHLGSFDRDIWILDKSGRADPFFESPANDRMAVFSPDGQWIAYVSDQSGQDEVYVRPYPRTVGARRLSTNGGRSPLWNRDGNELFYREGKKMMSVAIETTPVFSHRNPVELFSGEYVAGATFTTYDIHPDGDRFLMVAPGESETTSETPQINVVLNWSEEVKERVPKDSQ
jgi:serine/threonine protein kinase